MTVTTEPEDKGRTRVLKIFPVFPFKAQQSGRGAGTVDDGGSGTERTKARSLGSVLLVFSEQLFNS